MTREAVHASLELPELSERVLTSPHGEGGSRRVYGTPLTGENTQGVPREDRLELSKARSETQYPHARVVYSGTSPHGRTTRPRMTRQQIRTSTATGPADTLLERADEVSGLIGA